MRRFVHLGLATLLFASPLQPQTSSPADRVSLLVQQVLEGKLGRDALRAEFRTWGREEIAALCQRLAAPGGNAGAVPVLIHALALDALDDPRIERRAFLQELLLERITGDSLPGAKLFFLEQLDFLVDDGAAPALAPLLGDPDLAAATLRVLVRAGGPASRRVIREALVAANDPRPDLVDAAAMLRDDEAIPALLRILDTTEDRALHRSCLRALASLGSTEARQPLVFATMAGRWGLQAEAVADCLALADRRAARGDVGVAAEIYRSFLAPDSTRIFPHVQAAALWGLARVLGPEAVDDVLVALTDDQPELRAAAREIAERMGTTAAQAMLRRYRLASASTQVAILRVMAARGETSALPIALEALGSENEDVRAAAVSLTAVVGGERELRRLVVIMEAGTPDLQRTVAAALVAMRGDTVDLQLFELLPTSSPATQAALIGVLAARGSTIHRERLLEFTRHQSAAVRVAALEAVAVLHPVEVQPALLQNLDDVADPVTRRALEDCAIRLGRKAASPDDGTAAPRALLADGSSAPETRRSLLRILGGIGGPAAFDTVMAAARDGDPDVRRAAFHALETWPSAGPADRVLVLAEESADMKDHVRALRAYARLVESDEELTGREKVSHFERGLAAARRQEEKTYFISFLGGSADPSALPILRRLLSDTELVREAATAALRVVERALPAGRRACQQTLEQVMAITDDEGLRARAAELLEESRRYDAITDFLVAGPYTERGRDGRQIFDRPFPPERPADVEAVRWERAPVSRDRESYWVIDLNATEMRGDQRAAYLFTRIHSPRDRKARLELGSDDGIKAWLNGRVVHENNVPRGIVQGEDGVEVELRSGANPLLLKVCNLGGGWAASLRVRGRDGARLPEVYATADDSPRAADLQVPTPKPEVKPVPPPEAGATGPATPKVLVYTATRGFRHASIPAGARALIALGQERGSFRGIASDDPAVFDAPRLAEFDVVLLLSTTGNFFLPANFGELSEEQKKAATELARQRLRNLLSFVRGGKGLVGIHAATDACYDQPEFGAFIGGYFDGHPWHEDVGILIEDPAHPVNDGFDGTSFRIVDEIYQFRAYDRKDKRVLLRLDPASTDMEKPGIKRSDGDFAVSWVKRFGQGRIFYCSLGHREEIFSNPLVLRHYEQGIRFAAGVLEGPTEPRPLTAQSWRPLYDGKSLNGWQGLVADPPRRARMTAEERAQAQEAADAAMREHWRADGAVLLFDGEGSHLCTREDFGNVELLVDWKIGPGGDSGIYLRGSPQVQIWDPAKWPEGSGGLYNNLRQPRKPFLRADRAFGEWNRFHIVMVDDRVTVRLNDHVVTEDTVLENYWERDRPIDPSGPIELQSHGSPLFFKNILVREIPEEEAEEWRFRAGWRPLLDSDALTGWDGPEGDWRVEDGVLSPTGGSGYLWHEQPFGDFVLELEFRLSEGANSGVFFRTADRSDPVNTGMEIQIYDTHGKAPVRNSCGALYDVAAPRVQAVRPAGEWNHLVLRCEGSRVQTNLNGERIVDVDLDRWTTPGRNPDGSANKFPTAYADMPRRGFLGLQNYGDRVDYRSIRIKPLGRERAF